jgi:hypothetical protein
MVEAVHSLLESFTACAAFCSGVLGVSRFEVLPNEFLPHVRYVNLSCRVLAMMISQSILVKAVSVPHAICNISRQTT